MDDAAAVAVQLVVVDIPFYLAGQAWEKSPIMVVAEDLKEGAVELSACRRPL